MKHFKVIRLKGNVIVSLMGFEIIRSIENGHGGFYPRLFWNQLGHLLFSNIDNSVLYERGFTFDGCFETSQFFSQCTGDWRTHFRSLDDFEENILSQLKRDPKLNELIHLLDWFFVEEK